MAILADIKDYQRGFSKHYAAYQYLAQKNETVYSRCLLLAYSVECGLKYKLLVKWDLKTPEEILQNPEDDRRNVIFSHNLKQILMVLGHESEFHFPQIKTNHNDDVTTERFHELCRYGILVRRANGVSDYEAVLCKVAEWIREDI